ncbi:unnamed protein product [Trichobilharzia szidati]|nr:unnamed protein product [Trichobilharzia szidati]
MSNLEQKTDSSKRKRHHRYSRTTLQQLKPVGQETRLPINGVLSPNKSSTSNVYSPHWSNEELISGVKNGGLLSGNLRINPRSFEDGYIKHPVGDGDVYISTLVNRNRALPNDIVAVLLEPKRNWRVYDSFVDQTATTETEDLKQTKKPRYVTVEQFIKIQPEGLEKLIGDRLAKQIKQDLDSPTDPVDCLPSEDNQLTYAAWWSVIQRTGRVVGILQRLHSRAFIGHLQLPNNGQTPQKPSHTNQDSNSKIVISEKCDSQKDDQSNTTTTTNNNSTLPNWRNAVLIPTDARLPRVVIPRESCPKEFQRHPESYKNVRFVGRITDWNDNSIFPKGELLRKLSCDSSNLIQDETDRILVGAGFMWGVDAAFQFPDEVNESVRQSIDNVHADHEKDSAYRKDFRGNCVFTIDPSTARDLDDALHIRNLEPSEIESLASMGYPNAFYEVGVHIADVSYFVRPDSPVDKEAAFRATSIYLVQLCVPMLPRLLCEEQCSLNPGEDKLAYSVVFTVTEDGKILTTWFGRTFIRSCCKLSYEDAQEFIDHPNKDWSSSDLVKVEHPYTVPDICQNVLKLHDLAFKMRRTRFQSGALRLDQVKTFFSLDDDNGLPLGVSPYIAKQSNWLIEEWMLAANKAVAERLAKYLPDSAFLRRHAPPSMKQLTDVSNSLNMSGINIDVDSAGSIQASVCREAGCPLEIGYHYSDTLAKLCTEFLSHPANLENGLVTEMENLGINPVIRDEKSILASLENEARLLVTVALLTKTMNLAVYFCLGILPSELSPAHYALNMKLYTHFTSPIRRYADVIVHRQLSATLAKEEKDPDKAAWYLSTALSNEVTPMALQQQAEVCNSKKLSARLASEESAELFFVLFVKETGPLTEVCAVTAVLDRSFDVLILSCGITRRVYLQQHNLKSYEFVPPQTSKGKIVEGGKLSLLWNNNSENSNTVNDSTNKDNTTTVAAIAGDSNSQSSSSCNCLYMEIKLFDVVRCSIAIDPNDTENDPNRNARQNSFLPKLLVTLQRPTCNKCLFV